jgi:hypothetical protein
MIVNQLALPTHMPRQVIPRWNSLNDWGAALATVIHVYAAPLLAQYALNLEEGLD